MKRSALQRWFVPMGLALIFLFDAFAVASTAGSGTAAFRAVKLGIFGVALGFLVGLRLGRGNR